ncbi:MAG: ABC transporter ATP-binding protein [Clostridia bacterium]
MKKLDVIGLRKSFGNVIANDSVNFDVYDGEVHAILGENGAGKTTLMKCIFGLYPPEVGEIYYEGQKFSSHSVKDSIDKGIGMVHQHFMLVYNMTVLENIMLGLKSERAPFLDKKIVTAKMLDLMNKYQINIDLKQEIRNLSVGAQQRVEILKMLYRKSSLLILDEPTAVLTPQEIEELFVFIRQYTGQGNSVVLITHKLDEILEIADRITVMRLGKNVGTFARKDIKDKNELAAKMVGEKIELSILHSKNKQNNPIPAISIKNLVVKDNRGLKAVDNVTFDMFEGEILGVAGVSGNGQTELAEALAGLRRPDSGNIYLAAEDVSKLNPRGIQNKNIRYIPEDRHKYGLILNFSVKDNLLLGRYYAEPYSTNGKLNHTNNDLYAEKKIKEFNVMTPNSKERVEHLSGGNQQKLILARELASQPNVLIATQPTRGLDVAAAKFIQRSILKQRDAGTAVLYVSTELEEIFEMSDRIMVLYKGNIAGIFDISLANIQEIGLLMAGHKMGTND